MKKNVIPRKFKRLIGRMLISTNANRADDIVHVYKNEYGYLMYNTRTADRFNCSVSMLRNGEIFELIVVE